MAKNIFLLRHGKPQFDGKGSYCIGCRTDLPLSKEGEEQARRLSKYFGNACGSS